MSSSAGDTTGIHNSRTAETLVAEDCDRLDFDKLVVVPENADAQQSAGWTVIAEGRADDPPGAHEICPVRHGDGSMMIV